MKWSRYNILFESKRNGWLLFSSASRNFMVVEDDQVEVIKGIMADPEGYDYSKTPLLYFQLREMGFIVSDTQDDDLYNITKMRPMDAFYNNNYERFTIGSAVPSIASFVMMHSVTESSDGMVYITSIIAFSIIVLRPRAPVF